jgi:N-acetylglutamate synthase-like GNAT family acetyltransferase
MTALQLTARLLQADERDVLAAALAKAGLAVADLDAPGRRFWRFETPDEMPIGFGGLEIHGTDALLRSLVILPPLRRHGHGRASVMLIENEAAQHGCRAVWLLTTTARPFFARLGYAACERSAVPQAIRATQEFAALCPASADVMTKPLDE